MKQIAESMPELFVHSYRFRTEQFSSAVGLFGDWIILGVEDGSFAFEMIEQGARQKSECVFGDLLICPPGVLLHRRVLRKLNFHFLRFSWQPEDFQCGKITIRDVARLSSTYAHLRCLNGKTEPANLRWKNHLLLDLLQLARFEAFAPAHFSPRDELIRRALDKLEKESGQEISLRAVAKSLKLSPVQFTRRFALEMGTTPSEYLTALRLQKARILLLETDWTLDAIARQCGYNNGFYLSRVFSRKMKISPSQFRASHRV